MNKCEQCIHGIRQQLIKNDKLFCTAINDCVDNCKFRPSKQQEQVVTPSKQQEQTIIPRKRKQTIQPALVRHDRGRPDLIPFGHQKAAIERYKNADDIALFFEMGCGKSYTILQIAQEKFKAGEIKGILIVAPNDVHKQWFNVSRTSG